MQVKLKPPTEFYTRAQIDRAFGLGEVDPTMATVGIAGTLGVLALGVGTTALIGYFIWRVAKKQRWV
jgi:hypothetical protein